MTACPTPARRSTGPDHASWQPGTSLAASLVQHMRPDLALPNFLGNLDGESKRPPQEDLMTDTATRQDRWDRLAADLAAQGITARIDRRPYTQSERGRVVHGVSSSIWIAVPDKGGV